MDILVLGSTPAPPTDTPSVLNASPLEFAEGQLVTATVQHVINSLVWLDVGDRTLIARAQTPLRPQQQVSLEVVEADPRRVTFRVLG